MHSCIWRHGFEGHCKITSQLKYTSCKSEITKTSNTFQIVDTDSDTENEDYFTITKEIVPNIMNDLFQPLNVFCCQFGSCQTYVEISTPMSFLTHVKSHLIDILRKCSNLSENELFEMAHYEVENSVSWKINVEENRLNLTISKQCRWRNCNYIMKHFHDFLMHYYYHCSQVCYYIFLAFFFRSSPYFLIFGDISYEGRTFVQHLAR